MKPEDVDVMAKDFQSRAERGRICFGSRRIRLLQALVHWTQDFYRVSLTPTIEGLDEASFLEELRTAAHRAITRAALMKQTKLTAESASPGPLRSERDWEKWEEIFYNYTRAFIGTHGVPLCYVIRENDDPDYTTDHGDFINKTIACAPLSGEQYFADRLAVFNMIVNFTTGESSNQWIKHTLKSSNGRLSMKALRDHFTGEGNTNVAVAEADRMRDHLHYTNERAMPFEVFLTQCQKMYNIYAARNKPFSEEAKVRFLFKVIHHDKLQIAINALRAQQTANSTITYQRACNHLSVAVSELPESIRKNRNVSSVNQDQPSKWPKATWPKSTWQPPREGSSAIYNDDGSIITGHIPTWRSLSNQDKDIVEKERAKHKRPKKGGHKVHRSRIKHASYSDTNQVKQLRDLNEKYRRQIKAMQRRNSYSNPNPDIHDNDMNVNDAGDEFGGRNNKERRRKYK